MKFEQVKIGQRFKFKNDSTNKELMELANYNDFAITHNWFKLEKGCVSEKDITAFLYGDLLSDAEVELVSKCENCSKNESCYIYSFCCPIADRESFSCSEFEERN